LEHRVDQWTSELSELLVPGADRRFRKPELLASVDVFDSIEGLVILPAAHDRVGEQRRSGCPALDR
jgi:hypothetical protein